MVIKVPVLYLDWSRTLSGPKMAEPLAQNLQRPLDFNHNMDPNRRNSRTGRSNELLKGNWARRTLRG